MNIVMFLGAGFSAPFGLPTMNQFFPYIDSSQRLTDDDRDFIGRLIRDSRQANAFIETSPVNLEDVLSLAVMKDRTRPATSGVPSSSVRLKNIIQRVYSEVRTPDSHIELFDSFLALFGPHFFGIGHRLSIVTTNYDLNAECALRHKGIAPDYGIHLDPIPNLESPAGSESMLVGASKIAIAKLHGSVNWFDCEAIQPRARVDSRMVVVPTAVQRRLIPAVCIDEYAGRGTPLIIPPAFTKPEMGEPFTSAWKLAATVIAAAHVLVFIGYSFPASDTEMRFLIGSALSDNASLRRIFIVDTAADAVTERLGSKSSGFGTHFRSLMVGIQASWTGAAKAMRIRDDTWRKITT